MSLLAKLERPLRRAIRDQVAAGAEPRLRRILLHPGQMSRLAAQVEVLAAQHGDSARLSEVYCGDESSAGFREILAFIMAHWSEILQLALLILPLVVGEDGTDASEE